MTCMRALRHIISKAILCVWMPWEIYNFCRLLRGEHERKGVQEELGYDVI